MRRTAPAWLAAVTVEGELAFRDIASILESGPMSLLDALCRRVRGRVNRIVASTAAGALHVYGHTGGDSRAARPPRNIHARRMLALMDAESIVCAESSLFAGSVLFVGERDGQDVGLTDRQQTFLRGLAVDERVGSAREPWAELTASASSATGWAW